MRSLDEHCQTKLAQLQQQGLARQLVETSRRPGAVVERGGRRLVSFSCNDYLGLAHHPIVIEAGVRAARQWGVGAGASRLITGHHPAVAALERALARLKGTEACLTFGSGYLTNLGVIPALVGPDDLILADELSHACLRAGTQAARSRIELFAHNDLDALEDALGRERAGGGGAAGRILVITEGVFSMDGDRAAIGPMAELCREHDAWLLVDDAHGFGTLADGRGSVAAANLALGPGEDTTSLVPLQVGTFSKALGTYGGYLCASRAVVDLLTSRSRTLVYSTGVPPSAAAAALAALELVEAHPERARRPLELAQRFARHAVLPAPTSAIVPVVVGEADEAMLWMRELEAEGFLVVAIRPPTVPQGTSRLRFAFSAEHREADVDRAAAWVHNRLQRARAA